MTRRYEYWWETPIEREERMWREAERPRRSRPTLPWYYRVDWVALAVWAIVLVALFMFLWQLSAPPVDPCGARCADARP